MFSKSALVLTTAAAIALTSFDLRPAQAASDSGPAIAKQNRADEFSAQRKRRGRVNPAVPLAAFGMIAGTIAGIAAAERQRDYYERPYGGSYAYGEYGYAPQVYAPNGYAQPGYAQPYGYAPRAYRQPGVYGHPGYAAPTGEMSPMSPPGSM